MNVYVVATTTPPDIFCPPWCDRAAVHLAELDDWDGRAVHQWHASPTTDRDEQLGQICLGVTLLPDGQVDVDPINPNGDIGVAIEGRDYTLDAAERYAHQILDMVAMGREYQLTIPTTEESQS